MLIKKNYYYLNIILLTNRIKFFKRVTNNVIEYIGVIDNDIVFVADLGYNGKMKVITFYGRISLKPELTAFQGLKSKSERNYFNLFVTKKTLELQTMPLLPSKVTIIESNTFLYLIEEYPVFSIVILTKIDINTLDAVNYTSEYYDLNIIGRMDKYEANQKYLQFALNNKKWIGNNIEKLNIDLANLEINCNKILKKTKSKSIQTKEKHRLL